ncbi:Methyltransferase type 11 [Granulicella tundricola MP5ACTX9]|uniref:Methyltransferase type 11 n=2 Tax=Granulicella TaxID=940557 RepID=E8X2U9_GRATM|nr:class I SAM-dependent methyltransferase [Granulicella tundricola]ADW68083.1 Methyltransferase type 11 [Granulicella tundricola MP5ACTX9]
MTQHAERFTGRVEEYVRFRSRYPRQVLDVLRERCGLTQSDLIADIGAGTGMLSELFLEAGNPVIAVEPNSEMRAACRMLAARFPKLSISDASAEATGLTKTSVDLVTVGRAFHWFDQERALAEFHRILRPGKWVTLVTNRRSQRGSAQAEEYENILLEFGKDYEQVRGSYRSFEGLRPYGGAETFEVKMQADEQMTLQEFVGQTQSLSVAPLVSEPGFEEMQRALEAFFLKRATKGLLTLETVCEVVGWKTPGDSERSFPEQSNHI